MKHNFITHSVLIITLFALLSNPINLTAQEQRNPLMEYVTGTWCPWCPCGDIIIQQILSEMPNAIFLGYHMSGPTQSDPWQEFPGDTIRQLLGFWLLPGGIVDRTGPMQERYTWVDSMNSRYNVPATVSITTNSTFNVQTRELNIHINSTALQNLSGNYRMNLVILEDSLVYPQAGNDSCTGGAEYVHFNVVRAMINGAEGEDLNGGSPWNSGETITKNIQYIVPSDLIFENCKLVVFVYKVQSELYNSEVQQAEKFSLISFPGPIVEITSPNGGESWPVGTNQTINWTSNGVSNVKIEYTTNSGSTWITIISSTPSDGNHAWTIPNTPSNNCKVKVSDVANPSISDESDDLFAIIPPTITVTSPNGGESIQSLSNYTITWSYQFVEQIDIEFTSDGGNSWSMVASNINTSNNSYIWSVPVVAPPSNQCKIKITSVYPPGFSDESDGYFSVFAKVSELVFNPIPGTYGTPQVVTISTTTDSVNIYYTIDGSDPTQSSTLYTQPIYLNSSVTLKARAYREGWVESDIQEGNYTFVIDDLAFDPIAGTYSTPQVVTITCPTDSVNIYYTIDGSSPTQSSTLYNQPINIDSTLILKARAYRSGWIQSPIQAGTYVISDQVIVINIEADAIWYDADYNGFETRTVNGSGSTISYGEIVSWVWTVDGDSIAEGQIADIEIMTGTHYLGLTLTSDFGLVISDSVEVSVYAAELQTNGPIYSGVSELSTGALFVSSTDDKIYRFDSTGSVAWTILTGGDIQSTIAIGNEDNIYAGSDDTRLYSFDAEGIPNWDKALGGVVVSSPSIGPDSIIYVGISTGRFFAVSKDGNDIIWNIQTGGEIVSSAAIDDAGNIYFGSKDGKLYSIASDGQQNWAYTTQGEIATSPALGLDSTIVFGSTDGFLYKLLRNGNLDWTFDAGSSIKSSPIIGLDGIIYFGSTNGKFYSLTKSGNPRWEYESGSSVNSVPVISNSGLIYFGTNDGNFIALNDLGEFQWRYLVNEPIEAPALITTSNLIYVSGTDGNVYILKEPQATNNRNSLFAGYEWPTFKGSNRRTGYSGDIVTSIQEIENLMPTEYQLSQNYPNPFNPSTKIRYSVPQSSNIIIKVYNILGNEMETLVDEEKQIGTYELTWYAEQLPSGVYFYRLQAGNFVETKKMVIIK